MAALSGFQDSSGRVRLCNSSLPAAMIGAQEAYRIGLVNEVVPAAELITRAEAILTQIGRERPAIHQICSSGREQGT